MQPAKEFLLKECWELTYSNGYLEWFGFKYFNAKVLLASEFSPNFFAFTKKTTLRFYNLIRIHSLFFFAQTALKF